MRRRGPLIVVGIGVALSFLNFGAAWIWGKSDANIFVFELGFAITAAGVVWGFVTRSDVPRS